MNKSINLQYPFIEEFKKGYLGISQGRRVLSLIRFDNTRTSISHARYLMSVKLERFLEKHEQVDHIDNNPLNDSIENLQILSFIDNILKRNDFYGIKLRPPITLTCPICNKEFTKPSRNLVNKLKNKKIPSCSRRCGGIYSHITKQKNLKIK